MLFLIWEQDKASPGYGNMWEQHEEYGSEEVSGLDGVGTR